ncbi:alpha/beta hydrolase [Streptosporangium sp. NPDC050855]|uniref:alpha/beta hydrolase n=1 Tax=Streptosporangium sp. NPDC050855 TaxID=3366194 RepID=UPI0037A20AF7
MMRATFTMTIGLGAILLAGFTPAAVANSWVPSSASYEHQRLTWRPCPARYKELNRAGARCAKVTVPLDHADPGGPTIKIAISRVAASSKAQRRGILLSNPGGPGGTGLANTLALRPALKDVAGRYDLIGFDPRFLGESTPIRCAAARPVPPPASTSPRRDFEASVRSARDTARRCVDHGDNARLLPHASTRNVARDMDVIRSVLRERRLSYYGVSYGADLGAVYTQMFPGRADRMVIDSSTDPAATQYELFRRTGEPLEKALDEWAGWVARHGGYRLGRTSSQVRAVVRGLLDRAERKPVPVGGTRLDAPVLRLVMRQLLQNREHDATLANVVRDLAGISAGKPVEPGPDLTGLLGLLGSPELADGMVGGALFMCGDGGWPAGGWPKDPETYWRNIVRGRATQPVFAPFVNGMIAPCAFWEVQPREPGTSIRNDVPVLMVQARRDNNVPYDGALALHRRLTSSRLVTADIRAHGVYGRALGGLRPVACVDRAVNDYLRGGPLPARDVTCEPRG